MGATGPFAGDEDLIVKVWKEIGERCQPPYSFGNYNAQDSMSVWSAPLEFNPIAWHGLCKTASSTHAHHTITKVIRVADVLAGFYLPPDAHGPCTATVMVGCEDTVFDRLVVEPGKFVFTLEGIHALPIVSLGYHEVVVVIESDVAFDELGLRGVWVSLDSTSRRAFRELTKFTLAFRDKVAMVVSGMMGFGKEGARTLPALA